MGSALLSTFPQPSGTKGEKTISSTLPIYTKFQIKLSQTIDTFRIAQGKTNAEIASELVVSKRTVEKHIAHIISKLGVTNRAQIVRWVIQTGPVKPDEYDRV